MKKGILYICPTPIGNLEDITLRTLKVLEKVDLIAAEDTRRTIKLLNHYEIKKPLTSYHEHNERQKGDILIKKLEDGINIGLVSDAGMPGISDPGEYLISQAIDNDIELIVLPGGTAAISALVLSGLPTGKFVFEGFLSSKKKDRRKALEKIKYEERTIILYESPYRVLGLLKDIRDIMGNRKISVSREITKVYEETIRGTVEEVLNSFQEKELKGEFVLTIEGGENKEVNYYENLTIKEHLTFYLDKGLTKKDAIKIVSKERNMSKNIVYRESLDI
ncbi:MAG TPA: 16S rRNA (cytidine(1402)-2'-O)-methyltransferase [Tissierellales bacterium]|nr:16S rRNA (cytidine(1402)-2'-O)-methyltransferase [Tissierellales bacterium]